MIWRWLPVKSAAPYWRLWGGATRFGETEVTGKEGAEERDGDDDEAEGLFGTAGVLSVVLMSAKTKDRWTNHAHLTRMASFPVEPINQGLKLGLD